MPDEPTPGELARNYDRLRTDMRDGFNEINRRLDRLPTGELVTSLLAALEHRVKEAEADVVRLENDIKEERRARAADRRIVISAAMAGVVSVIVTLVTPFVTGGGA